MSLEIVRHVHAKYPHLLAENLVSTCNRFKEHVIEHLRAANFLAFSMCKTQGESQYVPPGFVPRDVVGLDSKTYRCTGVSHDAIWCDGKQVDLIASANDEDHPLIIDGRRVHASPVWHEIPEQYWRPNNPPLRERNTTVPPPPVPARPEPLSKAEAYMALQALNGFYQAQEGLQRPGGLVIPDAEGRSVADMQAIAQWFYQLVIDRVSLEDVFTQIRSSHEWRSKHGENV